MPSNTDQPKKTLVSYPFPLSSGRIASLYLPAEGLTKADAERLKQMIDSFVTEGEDVQPS